MITGTTQTLGNCLTWRSLPLSHDPGRHSLRALFALLRGSLKFSCTPPGWKKDNGSHCLVLVHYPLGCKGRATLCCHWLPPSLLFQPAVFLAVNPLLQVKRSKESLDCSLDLPRVFNFKSLCPQHLPRWKVLHAPSLPAKPDSFLLYSTPSTGWPRARTFTGVISACACACGVAYISCL